MRRAVLFAAAAVVQLAAFAFPVCAAEDSDHAMVASADDAALADAQATAIRTLPIFWKRYAEQNSPYYALSVSFSTPGGSENLWARPLKLEKDRVLVRIVDEPLVASVKVGDKLWVDQSRIVDWQYAKAGRLYGAFSTRALMNRASPDQRAAAVKILASTPLEPGDQ